MFSNAFQGMRTMLNNEEGVTGKILTFDFNHHSNDVREIEIEGATKPKHLNPLGLDIWEDKGKGRKSNSGAPPDWAWPAHPWLARHFELPGATL